MATENLAQMADGQLMKLFSISSAHGIGKRQKQIMAELERRGYLFDREHKDFVTCEQWNARHGDMPIDCEQRARWFDSP